MPTNGSVIANILNVINRLKNNNIPFGYYRYKNKIRKLEESLEESESKIKNSANTIQEVRRVIREKHEQVEKLKSRNSDIQGELVATRKILKSKAELYVGARRYFQVYQQGFLADEIEKSDVDLSADCYLSLLPSTVPAALQLKRIHGGTVVCDCVENVELEKQSLAPNMHPPTLELANLAAYGALSASDKLMTIGESLNKTLERYNRPTLVLPNYRNFEVPDPFGTLRERCGLSESDVLLFASGNVVVGFEPLIEALAGLPDSVHLAALVRLKPSEYEARILAQIDRYGLTERVHFFPFVPYEQLASTVADADVGLIISDTANPNGAIALPNRLFDYLTGGLPVIAPPMPDVVELLDKYGFGCHLSEVTSDAWETALRSVLADLSGYRAATERARREICWENNEDELYEFLGRPKRLTMLGFRDLSRYQRFQRIGNSLAKRGTKIRAVFYSTDPLPTTIEDAEFYHFDARYGDGPGLRCVPHVGTDESQEATHA